MSLWKRLIGLCEQGARPPSNQKRNTQAPPAPPDKTAEFQEAQSKDIPKAHGSDDSKRVASDCNELRISVLKEDGSSDGPFALEEIHEKLRDGTLCHTNVASYDGAGRYERLSTFPGCAPPLFAGTPSLNDLLVKWAEFQRERGKLPVRSLSEQINFAGHLYYRDRVGQRTLYELEILLRLLQAGCVQIESELSDVPTLVLQRRETLQRLGVKECNASLDTSSALQKIKLHTATEGEIQERARQPLEHDLETTAAKLLRLQQYTLAELEDGNAVRVLVIRKALQDSLLGEFQIHIASIGDAERHIRDLGEALSKSGGLDRMKLIAYRIQALGGSSRQLDFSWNGIGGWRA